MRRPLRDQNIRYRLNGQILPISTLSSGEKEVFIVAFDFLMRQPTDCVILFDEPELHLHTELAHRLITTLQAIGARNQFILTTHSPDIISGSFDHSIFFLAPPNEENGIPINQAVPVSSDDTTNQALKLLGQSIGIVALGKRIVLIEGADSSTDKRTYTSIIQARFPSLVLVPSGGRHGIESFSTIYESILRHTIWGVDFFMLCDGDSTPRGTGVTQATQEGRLHLLSRYHLENYFLDENVWAVAFEGLEEKGSWLLDPNAIRERLRAVAKEFVSYAVALHTSAVIRQEVGNVSIMPGQCHGLDLSAVITLLQTEASNELTRTSEAIQGDHVASIAAEQHQKLTASLNGDTEEWKALIPGKQVLAKFAALTPLKGLDRVKKAYVRAADTATPNPFQEIIGVFETFSNT